YKTSDSEGVAEGLAKTADFKHMPEESESLLYDTLKLVKKFEAAVALLERNDFAGGKRIRTVEAAPEIIQLLESRNGSEVYGKSLDKHPVLRDYWQEYLRLYEVFIFQPVGAKTLTPLYREGTLEKIADHLARLEKNLQDP